MRDLLSTWTNTYAAEFSEFKKVLPTQNIKTTQKLAKLRVDTRKLNGFSVILYQQHQEK